MMRPLPQTIFFSRSEALVRDLVDSIDGKLLSKLLMCYLVVELHAFIGLGS